MTSGGFDDANKRHHVFGNPDHGLEPLVRHFGSEESAAHAIVQAANEAYRAGTVMVDLTAGIDRYLTLADIR